jgi:glycosyltransferase involved in cell wall biosynthesis
MRDRCRTRLVNWKTSETLSEPRHLVFVGGTSEPGGLHIHTADVAQASAALGCKVSIICTSVNYFEGLISDANIDIRVIPRLKELKLRRRLRGWRKLSPAYRQADFIFCRGRFAETHIAEIVAARCVGRRVYTIDHRPWEGDWTAGISKKFYGHLSGILVHRAIAVSDEIQSSAVRDFGFPAARISTCLNWVDPAFRLLTRDERREARASLSIAPDAVLLCYLGRLAPEKRVDSLLRAFAAVLPGAAVPVQLMIAGDGWKRDALASLAGELGITDRVCFTGWSTTPRKMLAACDIFVLPSLVEGFPLALLEAMSVGCACLAHPMPSTRFAIENGKSGVLADLSETESFAAALLGLIRQGAQGWRTMGSLAAARVEGSFSRERRLPELLAALDLPVKNLPLPEARTRTLAFGSTRA